MLPIRLLRGDMCNWASPGVGDPMGYLSPTSLFFRLILLCSHVCNWASPSLGEALGTAMVLIGYYVYV